MSKTERGVTRVKLSDWKGKKRDEGAIEIEVDDGTIYRIDPPDLWPDDALKASEDRDPVALATALVGGSEKYQAFVAAGGNAAIVAGLLGEVHGVSVGESSASSSS